MMMPLARRTGPVIAGSSPGSPGVAISLPFSGHSPGTIVESPSTRSPTASWCPAKWRRRFGPGVLPPQLSTRRRIWLHTLAP